MGARILLVLVAVVTEAVRPNRYLFVRVDDLNGAITLEAGRLGVTPGAYVRREMARSAWLRDVQSRGGRLLVEDERGLLREVAYPGGAK